MGKPAFSVLLTVLSLASVACSTGSGHPLRDAGVGGSTNSVSESGGSGGVAAAPILCGKFETSASNMWKSATLQGEMWADYNRDPAASAHTTIETYGGAANAVPCVRGKVVHPNVANEWGWAMFSLDVNTVLQSNTGVTDAAGADAGALSAWSSMVPQTEGLVVNVDNKAQSKLWVCLQGANLDKWCVKAFANDKLIRWSTFLGQSEPYAPYAMQPLMSIDFVLPDDAGSFDFCVNSAVESAPWCACPGGTCECSSGNTACAGTCVPDTSTNPLNCGKCGTVCSINSACVEGECNEPLYSGLQNPNSVLLDGNNLYYTETDAGRVMHTLLGGAAPEPVVSAQDSPTRLAVHEGNLYWVNTGTAAAGFTDGAIMTLVAGVPTELAKGQTNVSGLAVDSKFVYWVNAGTQTESNPDGAVMKVDLANPGNPVTLASSRVHPRSIAVDSNAIYWAEQGTAQWGKLPADGHIMKLALNGTPATPQALASNQSAPLAVALDANNLYYSTSDSIFKIALADGQSTILATGQSQPYALAVDTTDVYWTSFFSGSLMSAPISGASKAVTVARAQSFAIGLALGSSDAYWVTRDGQYEGAILKTPK